MDAGRSLRAVAGTLALALAAGGCGDKDDPVRAPDPATERSDRAAKPPAGWRVVANRRAGFTLSVPGGYVVRTRGPATLVRSADTLLAMSVAADRGQAGRDTPARQYAPKAFAALPGFKALRGRRPRKVPGSPYESARVDGSGTLASRKQRQRITVAAFRRPGRVTYTAVVFAVRGAPHKQELRKVLASLRGRRPLQ